VPALLEGAACPGCGRTTPRLLIGEEAAPAPAPARPRRPRAGAAPASRPRRPEPAPEEAAGPPVGRRPPFAAVLDGHPGVADWQAELRVVDGDEELLVFLAPSDGQLTVVLQDLVRAMHVTQFVVLPAGDLAARRERHGGDRIVDLRP